MWDWQTGQVVKTLSQPDSIFDIAFNRDNRWLASGADDRTVRLWNIEAEQVEQSQHYNAWISHVAFSPDDELLASSAGDNNIPLWNIKQNKLVTSLKVYGDLVSKLIFSQNSHSLIVSSTDGSIRIYTVPTGQLQSFLVTGKPGNWLSCEVKTYQCLRSRSVTDWFISMTIVILILLLGNLFLYFRFYRHPLVVALSAQNSDLLTLPLPQLVAANQLLRRTHQLKTILARCQISPTTFAEAIAFTKSTPLEQVEILVTRLNASYQQQHRDLFVIHLPDDFPLNLASCLFYFPYFDKHPTTILQELEWQEKLRWQKVVIITLNLEQQQKLRPYGEDVTTLWVVPNASELTRWLLSPNPIHEFAKIVATQLKVTHISPYQTQGGINKKDLFFGRTSILTFILHRNLSNYLVVGGRQIGKSSLLKYLDRYYHDQPDITCYYLSLHSENIVEKLAHLLKLPSRLDEIVTYLVSTKQHHLFLIDEADQFIQTEIQQNYPTLTCFHNLSEEGHCYFVLAGFWQLYQAAVLDYHSPLRNFGEIITLAELELEACHDLIVKPL
ncbi:MAG: hypothetical protein HC877_16505 [Thioploca sp.]|nr:hypothetical protein [Thioploca sp.]